MRKAIGETSLGEIRNLSIWIEKFIKHLVEVWHLGDRSLWARDRDVGVIGREMYLKPYNLGVVI